MDAEFSKVKMRRRVPLPIRCQPRSGALDFRCRPVARITFKELISHTFLMVTGQVSGAKTDFSAVDRGIATGSSSWGPEG
jgi:hypothetical protein